MSDGPGTVSDLPAEENERYVDRQQLADIMGVSVATIDRMVAKKMPSVTWGRRTRRFKPSTALAWARAQEREAA
jgi:phage terminase Nu1 subunit (DNA packaging protein)